MSITDRETEGSSLQEITGRLVALRGRIDLAARRSGRAGGEIRIVAVTKTRPAAVVRAAALAGLLDFGENYVQEALGKQEQTASLTQLRWHLIGHLQSNKTNAVAGRFALIQTVDSVKLGRRLGLAAAAAGTVQDVLVQIKLGGEATKSGAAPSEIPALCAALGETAGVRVRGLMAIAPLAEDGFLIREPRRFFAEARAVFQRLPSEQREILSMGMSADFETAIEEGSNMVRIGTTLFGKRT